MSVTSNLKQFFAVKQVKKTHDYIEEKIVFCDTDEKEATRLSSELNSSISSTPSDLRTVAYQVVILTNKVSGIEHYHKALEFASIAAKEIANNECLKLMYLVAFKKEHIKGIDLLDKIINSMLGYFTCCEAMTFDVMADIVKEKLSEGITINNFWLDDYNQYKDAFDQLASSIGTSIKVI